MKLKGATSGYDEHTSKMRPFHAATSGYDEHTSKMRPFHAACTKHKVTYAACTKHKVEHVVVFWIFLDKIIDHWFPRMLGTAHVEQVVLLLEQSH
jgi:hypothetical protein